jgi:hypothetical protein
MNKQIILDLGLDVHINGIKSKDQWTHDDDFDLVR